MQQLLSMITVMASVMIVQTALIYQVQNKTSIARKSYSNQAGFLKLSWALTFPFRRSWHRRRRYALHLPRRVHNRLPGMTPKGTTKINL
jgi:hypothetical protein